MVRYLKASTLGLLCVALLAGCITVPELSTKSAGDAGSADEASSAASIDQIAPAAPRNWEDAAQDVNSHRADGWGLVSMPRMETYLRAHHQRLKDMAGYPDWPGSVYVLANPSLKASSSAAGNIYISIGWLNSIKSEDEMFALLSHEFGHVYLNHHVVHDVKDAGDTASRLATVAWMIAQRKAESVGVNGAYLISGLRELANGTLITAWQRSIEQEADRFGAAMSLRAGYSYPQGFKVFLERIATYESDERDRAEAAQPALAVDARERMTRKQSGSTTPMDTASQNLLVNINTSAMNLMNGLSASVSTAFQRARETHDSAEEREDVLTKAVEPLLVNRNLSAQVKPWAAALRDPPTAEKLAHYAMLTKVETALAENRLKDAQRFAQKAASGTSALDAMPLYYLSLVNDRMKARPDGTEVLRRHLKAPERSWILLLKLAERTASSNVLAATALLEEQFADLGKVSVIWPDLIAFYRDHGQIQKAKSLSKRCVLQFPAYREPCAANATTESERMAQQAANERKSQELAERLFRRKSRRPR